MAYGGHRFYYSDKEVLLHAVQQSCPQLMELTSADPREERRMVAALLHAIERLCDTLEPKSREDSGGPELHGLPKWP